MRLNDSLACLLMRFSAVLRVKHMRGHGVHSPFAYYFVREVYMHRKSWQRCEGKRVYEDSINAGFTKIDASFFLRLYEYVKADACLFYAKDTLQYDLRHDNVVRVFLDDAYPELSKYIAPESNILSGVTVIISPHKDRQRYGICGELINSHNGLSIDCRRAVLLFHYSGLSKEHIRL